MKIDGEAYRIRPIVWREESEDSLTGYKYHASEPLYDMQFEIVGTDEDGWEIHQCYTDYSEDDGFTPEWKTLAEAKAEAERIHHKNVMQLLEKVAPGPPTI